MNTEINKKEESGIENTTNTTTTNTTTTNSNLENISLLKKFFHKQDKDDLIQFILKQEKHIFIKDNKNNKNKPDNSNSNTTTTTTTNTPPNNLNINFLSTLNKFKEYTNSNSKETIESLSISMSFKNENDLLKNNLIKTNSPKTDSSKISKPLKSLITQPPRPKPVFDFSKTKHLAFKFLYIGKNYEGLVVQQSTTNTIEEKIFKAFISSKFIKCQNSCNFSRCGRTDKGVSAFGNVFDIQVRDCSLIPGIVKILNSLLPQDIRILAYKEVDYTFDSRFSCLFREYKYFFMLQNMDIELIKKACIKLVGDHYFYNFCKIDKSKFDTNYNRRIYEFKIVKCDGLFPNIKNVSNNSNFFDMYYFQIKGSAFLWHQIRCIVGIIFLIGNKNEDISIIDKLLAEKNTHYNYQIASDKPLVLSNCQFESVDFYNSNINAEISAKNYYDLSSIYEEKMVDITLNSYFMQSYVDIFRFNILPKNDCTSTGTCSISTNTSKKSKEKNDDVIVMLSNDYFIDYVERNPEHNYKHVNKYKPLLSRKRENDSNNNGVDKKN